MRKVELLSPAKNFEIAVAAINSGADAIYIGASDFGARVNASNSLESIEKLVNYAHKFYVRVHVTINTILNNDELKQAIELVKKLYSIGVDAIIVQDMGLIKASIEGKIPPVQIHASTQCNNRTLKKVKFFDKIGVSRVILARELSLEQIDEICNNTNCEIETFIHGALCVSYSGQCYMSYANGGRSANKGQCAQPCRKKYTLIDEDGKIYLKDKYLLSLKDFNASEYIEKLINSGVKSFKIEGRLKDENYVKNVTLYYNNLINKYAKRTSSGKVFADFEPDVNKTFNRSYTDYFLNGRTNCYNFLTPKSMGEYIGKVTEIGKNYIETDSKIKLNAQDGICFEYKDEFYGFKINKTENNKIFPNNMPQIEIGTKLYRNYDNEFEKILSRTKTPRNIGVKFQIFDDKIVAEDTDFNRVITCFTNQQKAQNPDRAKDTVLKQLLKTGDSDFYVINAEIKSDDIPFLPVSEINKIRRLTLQNLMNERIKNYPKLVQNPISYAPIGIGNLDSKFNIFNDEAKSFYENCGCEVCDKALESKKIIPAEFELMRCKHCLRYACDLCSKKVKLGKKLYLQDEQGKKYPLRFECDKCEMVILSP
ncbi:U32 family peptidase [bacterium]|nr:U32 family peptidase [bacterium]